MMMQFDSPVENNPTFPASTALDSLRWRNDHDWSHCLRVSVRSTVDFLLAELRHEPSTFLWAAKLVVWHQGRFRTVLDLVEECASHNWNGMIYEAWVWETANRVHRLMAQLGETAARAVMIYAMHLDFYERNWGAAQDAIREARAYEA